MKKPYVDLSPSPIEDAERKGRIGSGDLWLAANNTQVLFSNGKTLSAIKGKTRFIRVFDKPISHKWVVRRINEFAEHVQATKLPRGPRRQADKDIAEIAKPIKRIRLKKEVA